MIRSRDEMSVMATVSGAAICRAIVEAHGGWLRDHGPGPEPGPRFTLTVPAGTAPAGGPGSEHRQYRARRLRISHATLKGRPAAGTGG